MPTRPPLSSTSPWARLGPPVASAFIFAMVVALPEPKPAPESPPAAEDAWADVLMVPAGALQFGEAEAKRVQKRPPCVDRLEVEWEGLCWVPHESKPPKCAPGLITGAGKCLMRVPAPVPPNTSFGQ